MKWSKSKSAAGAEKAPQGESPPDYADLFPSESLPGDIAPAPPMEEDLVVDKEKATSNQPVDPISTSNHIPLHSRIPVSTLQVSLCGGPVHPRFGQPALSITTADPDAPLRRMQVYFGDPFNTGPLLKKKYRMAMAVRRGTGKGGSTLGSYLMDGKKNFFLAHSDGTYSIMRGGGVVGGEQFGVPFSHAPPSATTGSQRCVWKSTDGLKGRGHYKLVDADEQTVYAGWVRGTVPGLVGELHFYSEEISETFREQILLSILAIVELKRRQGLVGKKVAHSVVGRIVGGILCGICTGLLL